MCFFLLLQHKAIFLPQHTLFTCAADVFTVHNSIAWHLKSTIFPTGSCLLESRIQTDTVYQKQEVRMFSWLLFYKADKMTLKWQIFHPKPMGFFWDENDLQGNLIETRAPAIRAGILDIFENASFLPF